MGDSVAPRGIPRKGKIVNLRIQFLDDSVHAFQVPVKAHGQSLWEAVNRHLQLVESDYFDLQYEDKTGLKCWLDHEKPILKQLPSPDSPLEFCVKFYTPDPGMLDEYTRYLYSLQIKKDLAAGRMHCSENTAALIASYIAQAEIGDFIVEEYADHTYLKSMNAFVPQQTEELLKKVMEYHKNHIGESPAEAESSLLDTARKVDTYGVKMCAAKDHEGVNLYLAVAHMGILVFQMATKINTFSWAKIRKLSFKRKKFLIKLHPESYGYYKDTVEFFFESRDECKIFWKKCIEHHAFFRCHNVKRLPRNKTRLVSRGSSFRYSGRTQKELMSYVRETCVKSPAFERSTSGRLSSSRSASVTPKISAKVNLHNSTTDAHNSTASSGSHILSPGPDDVPTTQETRETAEIHSVDSSLSGSRSLASPKFERSREGTPGDGMDEDEAGERGASSNTFVTNAIVVATAPVHNSCDLICNQNMNMSANQNANDNDISHSQYSSHDIDNEGCLNQLETSSCIDNGREKSASVDSTNILSISSEKVNKENSVGHVDSASVEEVKDSFRNVHIVESSSTEQEQVTTPLSQKSPGGTLGREQKKVVFADDVKGNGNSSPEEVVVSHEEKEEIAEVVNEAPQNISDVTVIDSNKEVELPSDSKSTNQVTEKLTCDLNLTNQENTESQEEKTKKVLRDLSLNLERIVDKEEVKSTVSNEKHKKNSKNHVPANVDVTDIDLNEDIPYYLHRRHFETNIPLSKSADATPNSDLHAEENGDILQNRRSRSLKKKRPSNMQVENVKVYEGSQPIVPKDRTSPVLHSPSSNVGGNKGSPSPPRGPSRSPSGKRSGYNSRSPSGKRTPGGMSPGRTSQERSPSCNRRMEVVNYHKLPPRDSFSSVDDTTSPTFEKEILKCLQEKEVSKGESIYCECNGDVVTNVLSTQNVTSDKIVPSDSSIIPPIDNEVAANNTKPNLWENTSSVPVARPVFEPKPAVKKQAICRQSAEVVPSNNISDSNTDDSKNNNMNSCTGDSVNNRDNFVKINVKLKQPDYAGSNQQKPDMTSFKQPKLGLVELRKQKLEQSANSQEKIHKPCVKKTEVVKSYKDSSITDKRKVPITPAKPNLGDVKALKLDSTVDRRSATVNKQKPKLGDIKALKPDGTIDNKHSTTVNQPNSDSSKSNQKRLSLGGNNQDSLEYSSAAAFILSESDYASKPNRNSITFSTFKPVDQPGSRPLSLVSMESDDNVKSTISLSTEKDTVEKLSQALNTLPPESVFLPTSPTPKLQRQSQHCEGRIPPRSQGFIRGPTEPRKVSFHKERGYMYSFESVNDPPVYVQSGEVISVDMVSKCSPESLDSVDMLEPLENLDENLETDESDTTESGSECSNIDFGEDSEHESDSDDEDEDDDDETERHREFLQFAKSLADSGKEITIDSGVGIEFSDSGTKLSPLDPLETLENVDGIIYEDENQNIPERELSPNKNTLHTLSTSSDESFNERMLLPRQSKKRVSVDPLESLENPQIAELGSFSGDSYESDTSDSKQCNTKLPLLTVSNISSPETPPHDNDIGQSKS